jgi:two-component system nitrogen regulation response regulator GlnG
VQGFGDERTDGRAAEEGQATTRAAVRQEEVAGLRERVPGLVIVAHPDPARVGETTALTRLGAGEAVAVSRLAPCFIAPGGERTPRPLEDVYLSRNPFYLAPGPEPGDVTLERAASRTEIAWGGERVGSRRVLAAARVEAGVVLVLGGRVALLLCPVDPLPVAVPHPGLIGESGAMLRLYQEIRQAAELEATVLLRGETGTGKELVARALHQMSRRRDGPYRAVNLAALPPALAASALFGAVRGAYTGADRGSPGLFQSARGGTLFLDEVGEAPPEVQSALLRALEVGEVQPVGAVQAVPVDVRVIAATDAALEQAIAQGRFRAPLFHRLAGFELRLPPLRERRDDIARLLLHFLGEFLGEDDRTRGERAVTSGPVEPPWPPAELVARLVEHGWPGNVRQLRNVARRLAVARRGGVPAAEQTALVERLLREAPLADPGAGPTAASPPTAGPPGGRLRRAVEVTEEELLAALEDHRWQLQPTAAALRVSRPTLYRLIDQCAVVRAAVELGREEIEDALARCRGELRAAAAELRVSLPGLKRRMTALGLR